MIPAKHKDRQLIAVVLLCVLLPSLGTSIVNIALPSLATYFSAGFQTAQWVVIAYLLGITVFAIIAGRLADQYGYRSMLLSGLLLFTCSSLLSVFASHIWTLIVLRGLQGIGASVLSTLSIVLATNNTDSKNKGALMGVIGTVSAIGTAAGPSIGGMLLLRYGWPSIFGLLSLLGMLTLLMLIKFIPDGKRTMSAARSIRIMDVLLLLLAIGSYSLAMTISKDLFNVPTIGLLLLAFLSGWYFHFNQRRTATPLLDSSLLTNSLLAGSLIKNFVVSTVMMTTLVVGPFFLAFGLNMNEQAVGWMMSVGPAISIVTGIPSGKMVDRTGAVRTMNLGLLLLLAGTLCLALLPKILGLPGYGIGILLLTPGYQLFQAANNTMVMSAAEDEQRGLASGILNLSRNTGLITGASLMGTIFSIGAGHAVPALGASERMFSGLKTTFLSAALLLLLVLFRSFANRDKSAKTI